MSITIDVPATLSNLGPGFDVVGMALSLANRFRIERSDDWRSEGETVDPDQDLVLRTAQLTAARFGFALPGLAVRQEERVPRSRGLGSSATARVAGCLGALRIAGVEAPIEAIAAFLTEQEGHPDNVVAALYGGLTIATAHANGLAVRRLRAPDLEVALCIPDLEVSTDAARAMLPDTYDLSDAVFNNGRFAFLLHGLATGDVDAIRLGLEDRIHQSYRAPLIGPVDVAFEGAVAAGAIGAFISGSGSTLAAFCPAGTGQAAAAALAAPFADGVGARALVVQPVQVGAAGV